MPEIEWPLESLQSSGSGLGFDEGFDEGLDEGLGFDGEPEMMTAPDTLQLGGGRRSQYQDDALDDDLGGGGLGLELDDVRLDPCINGERIRSDRGVCVQELE